MKLTVNGRVVSKSPTPALIRASLVELDVDRDGEGFLILERDKMTYLQASGDSRTGFDVEYQEGTDDEHYQVQNAPLGLEEVAAIFCDYLQGDVSWEKYGQWSEITW